jgi:hypothetical protein
MGACDNTLDLNAEFQDIPVVYGLLSVSEENQFIRVERAFLDPNLPAPQIAVDPAALYYPSLSVSLLNVNTSEKFELRKINGNEAGLQRDEGAFAVDPNTLYTISTEEMKLSAGETYQLQIDRGENTDLVTATTTVVDTLLITQPAGRINFGFDTNFRVRWFPKSTGSEPSVFDVSMLIYLEEINVNNPDAAPVEKVLTWSLGKSLVDETEVLKRGDEFFVFLNNNLEVVENLRRDFKGIDVVVDAGGDEILDYVRVGQANLGITASQEIPFYTNLSEGRGIFSSRNRKFKRKILLTSVAQEIVKSDPLTRDLNINF